MQIDADELMKWLNEKKDLANKDCEHYKRSGDREEVDRCSTQAGTFHLVIDQVTRMIK